jgi:hypothetical protein
MPLLKHIKLLGLPTLQMLQHLVRPYPFDCALILTLNRHQCFKRASLDVWRGIPFGSYGTRRKSEGALEDGGGGGGVGKDMIVGSIAACYV